MKYLYFWLVSLVFIKCCKVLTNNGIKLDAVQSGMSFEDMVVASKVRQMWIEEARRARLGQSKSYSNSDLRW